VQEGTGFVLQAGFTDTDVVDRQASDYTAVVNWGDGSSDTLNSLGFDSSDAPISGSAGQFTINDGHYYQQPGSYTIQLTVTDPAGQSWVGTTTAAVSAAPLTVTGGLVDDAVPGVAVTQTLASFTDANVADPASNYAATVNWGDGNQTSGVISGSDGDFVVSGTHAYAAQGNYQVTVTVSNAADQTTGSATSTMDVGAIYAGQPATLQVASFTSSNPNAVASNFSATITWGDGTQSAGVVTGSNGQFQVTGTHTYAADGSYAVQVAVADQYGDTLSTTGTVSVVRDPLGGYGNTLEATAGVALNNALVGVFTDPDAGDQSGEYTALINWGDGTAPTVGTIIGGNGLFDVLGSHTYASVGEYVPTVQVEWGDPIIVGTFGAFAAVGFAPADKPKISGPAAVPGNSIYRYSVEFNPGIKAEGLLFDFNVSDPNINWQGDRPQLSKDEENVLSKSWDVRFPNKPEKVTISLTLKRDGKTIAEYEDLPVNIVQVKVDKPRLPDRQSNPNGFTIVKSPAAGAQLLYDTTIDGVKKENTKGIQVSGALGWDAGVTLIGPNCKNTEVGGGDGVQYIRVGFYQYDQPTEIHVYYNSPGGKGVLTWNVKPAWYRDVARDQPGPWYTNAANAILFGPPEVAPQDDLPRAWGDINSGDGPSTIFPVAPYDKAKAYLVTRLDYFTLDVSAATTAIKNSPIWAEANASQANKAVEKPVYGWTLNLSGIIDWDAKGETATWSPIPPMKDGKTASAIIPPTNWVPVTNPYAENQELEIANAVLDKGQWVSK
jgi:PKD repeat protein